MHTVKLNFYTVFDKISGNFIAFTIANCDGAASRYFIRLLPVDRFDDYEIYRCGEYKLSAPPSDVNQEMELGDNVTLSMFPESHWVFVPWSAWRRPETKAELLAPLGLSPDETAQIVATKQSEMNRDSSLRA